MVSPKNLVRFHVAVMVIILLTLAQATALVNKTKNRYINIKRKSYRFMRLQDGNCIFLIIMDAIHLLLNDVYSGLQVAGTFVGASVFRVEGGRLAFPEWKAISLGPTWEDPT